MRGLLVALALALAAPASAHAQLFRRPVACSGCIADWYYFDENASSGATQDWNCGTSTYDGHRGTDFSLAGGNGAIDTGYDIVAAADGVVRSTADGFYDHCTSCPAAGADPSCGLGFGGGFGNHVAIDHGTHTVYYAHMRTGSVRVHPGDHVTCGQVIGQIGSSGCTTGAHTHFEPRPLGGAYTTAMDSFAGSCSSTSPSLWVSQGAYRSLPDATCDGSPPPPTCPSGWYTIWTCEGAARRRCIDGVTMVDDCSPGTCESRPTGTDDVCDADGDGFATDEGDCDDHAASAHPGGTEVCGDGIDQDCTGGDEPCPAVDAGTDAASTPDAGAGTDASVVSHDGGGGDGAAPADARTGGSDAGGRSGGALMGGCGCRAGHRSSSRPAWWALVALTLSARLFRNIRRVPGVERPSRTGASRV